MNDYLNNNLINTLTLFLFKKIKLQIYFNIIIILMIEIYLNSIRYFIIYN